jgi:hypothetical protein
MQILKLFLRQFTCTSVGEKEKTLEEKKCSFRRQGRLTDWAVHGFCVLLVSARREPFTVHQHP